MLHDGIIPNITSPKKPSLVIPASWILSYEVSMVTWVNSSLMRRTAYSLSPSVHSALWSQMGNTPGICFLFLCVNGTFDGNRIQLLFLSSLASECKRKNSWPGGHQLGLILLLRTQKRHFPFWSQGSPSTKQDQPLGMSWGPDNMNHSVAST